MLWAGAETLSWSRGRNDVSAPALGYTWNSYREFYLTPPFHRPTFGTLPFQVVTQLGTGRFPFIWGGDGFSNP